MFKRRQQQQEEEENNEKAKIKHERNTDGDESKRDTKEKKIQQHPTEYEG